jgi:thymidylate synthase ThyX
MTFEVTAKVLADSLAPNGNRLTSFQVTGHRFILAELNTHRALSRNSASSRAIPYKKMRAKVLDELAFPVSWPAEQKGMQGGAELDEDTQVFARNAWREAALSSIHWADQLHEQGIHKSVINRLLEPYIPHTAILSATEWDNFFEQRLHPDAQPEIHELAKVMKVAMDESTPVELAYNQFHTPYIQPEDYSAIENNVDELAKDFEDLNDVVGAISVARCARVSYLTQENKRDIMEDINLYKRLRDHKPAHASPFEHVAQPIEPMFMSGGNFRGWRQLRHILGLG